ncbi:MAG: PAS domain S-box protein, partial [Atribacterota bacterium]|nr:PAS domain S-box protein [Atribacterota bacterium]
MVAIGKERTDKKDNVKDRGKLYLKKKILQSEARLKISFDFAPVGCYISDLKGTFFDNNQAAEKITGYTRDELSGKNYHNAGLL